MSESAVNPQAGAPHLPFPLQDGERVLQLCQRHWVYLWPTIAVMALVALVPVILAPF